MGLCGAVVGAAPMYAFDKQLDNSLYAQTCQDTVTMEGKSRSSRVHLQNEFHVFQVVMVHIKKVSDHDQD